MAKKTTTRVSEPMTQKAASRIQSATARSHGGKVPANSFAARTTRAATKNSK